MYHFDEKIERRLEEIYKSIYRKEIDITTFKVKKGKEAGCENTGLDDSSWDDFSTGSSWGGYGEYQWFRKDIVIPKEFDGDKVALRLDSPGDLVWKAAAEYTVFLNGKLTQGLDIFHQELLLSEKAKAGDVYKIAILGFSPLADKKTVTKTKLVAIDPVAETYYFNIKVAFDSFLELEEKNPDHFLVQEIINESVNRIDFRIPKSDAYYDSLKDANNLIEEKLYKSLSSKNEVTISAIGHTHIDVAWLWQLSHTREKCARSFSTVDRLMDRYPEYIFMQSQPQLYQYMKDTQPELYGRIKKRIAENRWEPEGGMWVEADCNLISGESMIRQFLIGKDFFKKEFGKDSKILWLPDVFGYSAAMPQILKKCGINYFLTTKISWNKFNRMPVDTFYLKGIDGTKVLTHFMTTPELRAAFIHGLPYKKTYNGEMCSKAVTKSWEAYAQKKINKDLIMAFGYGDGGGGPSKEMLEISRRLKDFPSLPKVRMQFPSEYFASLEERLRKESVPEWVGELYLEYHRGTYTSMARNKKLNRKCEFLYLNIEAFSVLAETFGYTYPRERLNENWKTILLNQFHDIIPGSSIGAVYDDSLEQYLQVVAEGETLLDNALDFICAKIKAGKDSAAVFNPNSNCGSGLAEIECPDDVNEAVSSDGTVYPMQKTGGNKKTFFAPEVPSKGYSVFSFRKNNNPKPADIIIEKQRMENRFFTILLDDKATITSIFDKRAGREVLPEGQRANVLQSFEDKPINFNAWDIDAYYTEKMWEIDDVQSVEVISQGPVSGTLRINRTYLNSTIRQDIIIYNDIDRIDFKTHIDWHEQEILLKAAFPVDINATRATYEIQYGNLERNTHANTSWDEAKFEVCMHKWMDLSEGDYGVSILNDCKYGGDVHGNVMRLTLLKSGNYPYPKADQEEHSFTYSLYPHKGTWKEADTIGRAYSLNNPFIAKMLPGQAGPLPESISFVGCDNSNVIIESVKKAEHEEAYILRLYESCNTHSKINLTFYKDLSSVFECNMLEENEKQLAFHKNGFSCILKPFEIKTFKVTL